METGHARHGGAPWSGTFCAGYRDWSAIRRFGDHANPKPRAHQSCTEPARSRTYRATSEPRPIVRTPQRLTDIHGASPFWR
jgi:hypothetical protein